MKIIIMNKNNYNYIYIYIIILCSNFISSLKVQTIVSRSRSFSQPRLVMEEDKFHNGLI